MSTRQDDSNDQSLSTTLIKLEHDSDDELIGEIPSQLSHRDDEPTNRLAIRNVTTQPLASAYKGKIEVTSKGRRKIFDGVRWQILCRRPGETGVRMSGIETCAFLSLKNVENKPIRSLYASAITKKNSRRTHVQRPGLIRSHHSSLFHTNRLPKRTLNDEPGRRSKIKTIRSARAI